MVEIPTFGYIRTLKLSGKLPQFIVYALTAVSVSLLCILGLLSLLNILTFQSTSAVDFFIFAILCGTGFYGIFEYFHIRRIYQIDAIFPDFVRDLAA